MVAVDILGAGGVVLDHDGPDLHGEGTLCVVGRSARPLDGARAVGGVTTAPRTELDLHRSLGVLVLGVGWLERSDGHAIDLPDNLVRCPVDGVLLVAGLAAGVCVESAAVVSRRLALSEVVGLRFIGVCAEPLPVDLVERV